MRVGLGSLTSLGIIVTATIGVKFAVMDEQVLAAWPVQVWTTRNVLQQS